MAPSRSSPEDGAAPKRLPGVYRLSFMLIYMSLDENTRSRPNSSDRRVPTILVIVNPQVAARQKSANDASREPNSVGLLFVAYSQISAVIGRGRSGALCPLVIRTRSLDSGGLLKPFRPSRNILLGQLDLSSQKACFLFSATLHTSLSTSRYRPDPGSSQFLWEDPTKRDVLDQ